MHCKVEKIGALVPITLVPMNYFSNSDEDDIGSKLSKRGIIAIINTDHLN